jgi:hypothetical protein
MIMLSCSTTHGSNSTWCNTVFLKEQPTGNLRWGLRFLWLVDIYMTLTRFKIHKNNDALGKSSLVNPKWNADRILASTVMDTFVGPMVLSQGCHKTRHYNNLGQISCGQVWLHDFMGALNLWQSIKHGLWCLPLWCKFLCSCFEMTRFSHCTTTPFVGNQQVIFIALDRIIIIMQTRSNLQHGSPQYLWLSGQVEGALVYWGYHLSWISSGCWWVVDTRLLSISCIACAKWPRPIRDQTCTFQYKLSPTSYQVNHGCAIAMCYQLSVMEPRRCKGTRDLLAFVSKLGT